MTIFCCMISILLETPKYKEMDETLILDQCLFENAKRYLLVISQYLQTGSGTGCTDLVFRIRQTLVWVQCYQLLAIRLQDKLFNLVLMQDLSSFICKMGKIGPISHHDDSKSHMTGLFDKCLRNLFCDDDATISEVEL